MTRGGEPVRPIVPFLVNTGVVVFLGVRLGKAQVRRPFCVACGAWFAEPVNSAVLPAEYFDELSAVVRAGDADGAAELAHRAGGEDVGVGCAIAQTHKCLGCGQMFADVVLKYTAATRPAMAPVRVTPEFVRALRTERAVPVRESAAAPDEAAAEDGRADDTGGP